MAAGIGVDVGGTATKGACVSDTGEVLLRAQIETDVSAATKSILAVVETLLERAAGEQIEVVSVGIGAAGFIDASKGEVTFSPNLVYDDPAIGSAVRARTGLSVTVDNDANAAAWGEYRAGAAAGVADLAFVTLGTGVGSGFVVGGSLLRGSRGAGAELGHIVIDPDGPRCPCGLKGCLEQFASGTAIERAAGEAIDRGEPTSIVSVSGGAGEHAGAGVRGEDVARAAREYDEVACRILKRAGTALGIGLSNVVNLFDPQVIVLGGSVVEAGEPYLGPARDRLAAMLSAQRRPPVRLDLSTLGNSAGVVGAALLGLGERQDEK